jgi:hypothetical protein
MWINLEHNIRMVFIGMYGHLFNNPEFDFNSCICLTI